MNTQDIEVRLKKLPSFLGVFPRDRIPNVKKFPASLVINTDKAADSGEHWVALYLGEDKTANYFDSFGYPPMNSEIINFLFHNCSGFIYNDKLIQSPISTTCGYYCIFFIRMLTNGAPFIQFVKYFSDNTSLNDKIVRELVK